jgi:hypothetical protein
MKRTFARAAFMRIEVKAPAQPLLPTLPSLLAKREPGGQFHIREEACFPESTLPNVIAIPGGLPIKAGL